MSAGSNDEVIYYPWTLTSLALSMTFALDPGYCRAISFGKDTAT